MLFYPSKVYNGTKEKPYIPEHITGRVMVNPKYKINNLHTTCGVFCDSGAFQDIDKDVRLTPGDALKRQLTFRDYLRTLTNPSFTFEALCIYDQMAGVDECLVVIDGIKKKIKIRGSEETAQAAVDETLKAAEYYSKNYTERIAYVAQGVNPRQYAACTSELLTMARSDDYYAMGGFCIIGRKRKTMLPLFYETCDTVFPMVAQKGISRIHLLGVAIPDAVQYAQRVANAHGLTLSTDSSAPEQQGYVFGRRYTMTGRPQIYAGAKYIDYDPRELAYDNVRTYNAFAQELA